MKALRRLIRPQDVNILKEGKYYFFKSPQMSWLVRVIKKEFLWQSGISKNKHPVVPWVFYKKQLIPEQSYITLENTSYSTWRSTPFSMDGRGRFAGEKEVKRLSLTDLNYAVFQIYELENEEEIEKIQLEILANRI